MKEARMKLCGAILCLVCVLVDVVSTQSKTKHYFYCHLAYGTMPDWTDSSCTRYWSCDDYDLSLQTCPDDNEAYSYAKGKCVLATTLDCKQQNEHFVNSLPAYLDRHTLLYTQGPIFTADNGETPLFTESPYCQVANGSLPDWTDSTCRRYWNCREFVLTLETCGENEAYYYGNGSCVAEQSFSCGDQNTHFRASLPAPRFPQDGVSTHPLSTNFQTVHFDRDVDFDFKTTTTDNTDKTDWHSLAVKQPQHIVEPLEVKVSKEVCDRLNIEDLEAVLNTALINMTGCPETNCTLPLFNLICP